MLATIDDYVTKIADDKMDYCLIVVHATGGYGGPDLRIPFQAHLHRIAEDVGERFVHQTIELVKPVPEHLVKPILLKGISINVPSDRGEIYLRKYGLGLGNKIKNVILAGSFFGLCHHTAFNHCIGAGVNEIHIPLDCVGGFDRGDYTGELVARLEGTHSKRYGDYIFSAGETGNFQLFVPGKETAYRENVNGGEPLLVAFHRSWGEMMELFERGRK